MFFSLFEIIAKVIAKGPRAFFKDSFNVLDSLAVVFSFIEIIVYQSPGVMSALRAVRFFKFLQFAPDGSSLRLLLDSISHTFVAIGTFTVLLMLFIYVYSLLGMQFFAGKLRFDK